MSGTDDDGDDKTNEPTFTRAQMAREVARQVREKVAAKLAEYGDLEELKRKADDADKNASKVDKMAEQLEALTKRAETAEIETARSRVADKLGLTAKEAKRLKGKTYDELLADGEELVDDLGIDVEARKGGKGKGDDDGRRKSTDDDADGKGTTGDDDADRGADNDDSRQRDSGRRRARPAEDLRSGAPMSGGSREESDPLKLVAGIPRR